MRRAVCLIVVLSLGFIGCSQPTETVPGVTGNSGSSAVTDDAGSVDASSEAPPAGDGASTGSTGSLRFVADTRLEVPEMMCPYGCYPAVEKTLAKVPGVVGVQLAEQPAGTPDGELKERIVELKVNDDFDADSALQALKRARYDASVIN
ncbi:MAG: heavy-metal-associated domain-containing protein [Pirellulaceae bacterium]|nr:heavy-metal-associated domain-containing protein [Pirellulaceae bacterium]